MAVGPINPPASRVTDKGTFTTTTTKSSDAMDMSHPQDGAGWASPLTEIDSGEDTLSHTTLVRPGTPPLGKTDSVTNKEMTPNT